MTDVTRTDCGQPKTVESFELLHTKGIAVGRYPRMSLNDGKRLWTDSSGDVY